MAHVPVIGRLLPVEYLVLFTSLVLVLSEWVIHVIVNSLPSSAINFCYAWSEYFFTRLANSDQRSSRDRKRQLAEEIANTSDFTDICALFGYDAEEHIVKTGDGFLLGLHRLAYRKGEEYLRVNQGEGSIQKKVVYLHHGLLMSSEVWVCLTEEKRCLPFQLVERGYDVWLGNNRGNKYSKKSTRHSPSSNAFWDFSIDQFAFHDIPDSIAYVLEVTGQPSLSFIGFSQGTTQAFAALSIHPSLNQRIDVFVALAPAMTPPALQNNIVHSLVKASPNFLFLLFGRRSILGSTTMWQTVLYHPIFVWMMDRALRRLFDWKCRNITPDQKIAAYLHLYSLTSTKTVVHWFQIIRNKTFQFYDDEVYAPFSIAARERFYKPAKYPTKTIKTPIVLLYGDSDSLIDIHVMQERLPPGTVAKPVARYEHLDFLWAKDVDRQVFGHVFRALVRHNPSPHFCDNPTGESKVGWKLGGRPTSNISSVRRSHTAHDHWSPSIQSED